MLILGRPRWRLAVYGSRYRSSANNDLDYGVVNINFGHNMVNKNLAPSWSTR
jgi:hypothetical protein